MSAPPNAAFTTLVTQASTALMANGGNLGAALRTLGSSASVKSLVASIATAGLENVQLAGGQSLNGMSGLSNLGQTGRSVFSGGVSDTTLEGITGRAVVSAGVNSAVLGQSFGQGLVDSVVADASAIGANGIGGTWGATGTDPNAAAQALAHGALGCAEAGLTGGHCAAGAAGAAAESVLGDVVTAAGGLPTDANGQVTTGAAAAYETGAAALGALAGQAAGGDAQSGLNTAVNSAANNYMAHVGDYVEALNACQQHPGGAGCGAILKMTQGSGVPIGSTPSGYAVAAHVGADGAPTSYVVTSPSGRQMILQPQEWGAFSQMTPGQQAAVFSAPQWSLDLTSTIVYAGNGDIAGAEANYGNMLRSPSYWGSMAAGLAMGTLGTLATLPETVGVEAVATNNILNFSQTTASPWFSTEGRFAGSTVSDIASQFRAGTLSPSDVPIQTIKIRGNNVVINTRSSLALAQAGIPQSQWRIVDMTGDAATEAAIAARLDNNGLTNSGTSTLRITGSGQSASTYVGSGSIPNPGAKQ